WTVWIATAEDSKPRKESPVHLVVYGKNGKTDSILLGDGKPDYFEANTTNEVDINVGSIGQIYKIRIGHENNDNWEGWHLKEVKMRDRKSKEELLFTFDRWMSRTDDDLDIVREMPVIRSGQNTLPVMKYQVQVYTGTVENADTEATCYICIYGERGDTGNRVLYKSLNNEIKFQKGQKDIFEIEAVHLGDLEKVVVGHNGKKSGQGWYIDKVIVRESSDSERGDYFPCNRWLDVSKDDRKVERELKPGSADGEWTLWITTAEDSRPCNNSAVHLVVYGEKDKTDPIILGDGKPDYFEAGTTDEEDIKVKDIGKIFKIRIGYDHGADWDGWHLEKVKMRERKTGEILEYQFDRWMSRTEDDLEIVREFPAIREGEDILPVLKYHIEVNTGTEENADTEATCYMCIYGERGDTGNRVLYKSLNNEIKFQKGQKDIFEIEAVHLGELKKVVVGHHGKEPGQGWFLSDVVIKEAQDAEEEVFFPNNRWLDVGQDDNTIERELLPGQREGEWDITIVTAEDSIPAMEAVVYLVVYGDQGKSDNIPLGDNDTVYFEPGRIDIFERVKLNVGKIYKIRIGHNDIDKWDGWHLQEVRMKERSTEEELIFRFDRWMARNQDDLDVLREMPAIRQDEEVLPIFRYFITVFTGEIENAACEATIYMCIYGERGDTGNRVLFKSLNNENQFQEGQVDMFEIEAVSLGELQKVVVGHDNKEAGQGWFCEKVIVKEAQDSDAEFHFPCS
ncbi:lipoxygenase homology domain-containing protein 1-like, partial [Saccoglossus kowalevskii]|uniref:Lipoxygenase homology domain-containing protein 1-like n=1 Tax=Saccoglossus kowalevskii TaxID=10224 RepID=A0ABM0MG63_SACKO